MNEETKIEALDELFKEWLTKRFPEESGFKLSKNLTYNSFNDETKAAFGKWLLEHYGMWSSIRNADETNGHRCVVVTIEMIVDNRLTNDVLGRLVKDDASHGLGDILEVVVTDRKPVRFVGEKDVLLEDEK